jgi:hypothetical protein
MTTTQTDTKMNVANEIARQIGSRAMMMIGGKMLLGDVNTLQFDVGRNGNGVTRIRVTVDPTDTYTVEFFKIGRGGHKVTVLATESMVYGDQLRRVIEVHTGMYTSL